MNIVDSAFWKNKRVFVTGCTGFKGSWLSLWLIKLGAVIKGYSLNSETSPSLFEICDLEKLGFCEFADIRNLPQLKKCLRDFQPEIVIHMAAQPLVLRAYQDPIETYETNVIGTANLLEACRSVSSLRAILNITTDKCYENKEWERGYSEEDELGGYDPYSSSKACAELVTKAYLKSFFNPDKYNEHKVCLATARAGNVIGGGDWAANRLIPDAAKAYSQQAILNIRNPQSTRPWQHVLEPLRGYLMLCERMYLQGIRFNGAFNFGPYENCVCSVEEVISKFTSSWSSKAKFQIDNTANKPHEAKLLKLDISKAQRELSWNPKLDLTQTLNMTAAWYKLFYSNPKEIKEFTTNQILELS
jgi:CDP-glucose 4,6-dehydratase